MSTFVLIVLLYSMDAEVSTKALSGDLETIVILQYSNENCEYYLLQVANSWYFDIIKPSQQTKGKKMECTCCRKWRWNGFQSCPLANTPKSPVVPKTE